MRAVYERIAVRCREVVASRPDWPCGAGCDACCRSLAEPPRATAAEWDLLLSAVRALPPDVRDDVLRRVRALSPGRRCVCPLLDLSSGRCRVYEARLAACRTYGFYVSGDKGAWCVRALAASESGAAVVFGNQDSLEAEVAARFGASLSMEEAFAPLFSEVGP